MINAIQRTRNTAARRFALGAFVVLGLMLSTASVQAIRFGPQEEPNENTVMLLHLDETSGTTVVNDNYTDFSGIGDAVTVGAPTQGTSSVNSFFDTAYGVSPGNYVKQYYAWPNDPDPWTALSGDGSDYTFDAWVKWDPNTSTAGRQSIVQARLYQGDSATGLRWWFNLIPITPNAAQLNLTSQSFGQLTSTTFAWDPNLWYQVAFTKGNYDSGDGTWEYNMYVTADGAQTYPMNVGSFTANDFYVPRSGGTSGPPSLEILVGTGGNGLFTGLLDDVRISNAVLSDFPATVPEPATAMLVLAGVGIAVWRRR